jgi:hypothetical protein
MIYIPKKSSCCCTKTGTVNVMAMDDSYLTFSGVRDAEALVDLVQKLQETIPIGVIVVDTEKEVV